MTNGHGEGRKVITEGHAKAEREKAADTKKRIDSLRDEKEKGTRDAKVIDEEITHLERQLKISEEAVAEFEGLGATQGNDPAVNKRTADNKEVSDICESTFGSIAGSMEKSDDNEIPLGVISENKAVMQKTDTITEEFLKTYKKDAKVNLGLQIGGLAAGLLSLALAIPAMYFAICPPKDPPPPPTKDKPDKTPANSAALRAAVPAGGSGAKKMTDHELEEMMQRLIVGKALIASGEMPQESLWKNFALNADTTDMEAQNLALIFIGQATVSLPGVSEFFWLDPTDTKQSYEALRAAHKRSGKFSDLYLQAAKVKYDGKEVPIFHTALLLQYALRLIKID